MEETKKEHKKKSWFKKHPILAAIGILFLIFVIIGALSGDDVTNTVDQSENAEQAQTQTPTAVITTEMIADFDKNQLAAEEKYKGKLLEFTAMVKNISEDFTGNPFLSLVPEDADEMYFGTSIQCVFKDKSQLTSLENGQTVTVRGTGDVMTIGIVSVKDCQIVQ